MKKPKIIESEVHEYSKQIISNEYFKKMCPVARAVVEDIIFNVASKLSYSYLLFYQDFKDKKCHLTSYGIVVVEKERGTAFFDVSLFGENIAQLENVRLNLIEEANFSVWIVRQIVITIKEQKFSPENRYFLNKVFN